ncbi:MAG TPA: protein kinase, partial [Candidatus Angelobacter sp.]
MASPFRIGQTLGHYRLLEQIGAGGMGVVFRAHDEHLERDVALKLLLPGTLADEPARKRFRREALTLSKLNHPNLAAVYDFDSQGDVDFLIMELIAGESIDGKLAAGPLPEKEILRLGSQMAEGLQTAHAHGVVHRDLKPSNLRVTSDGRLKILDFGLAELLLPASPTATTESLIESHAACYTLPYAAPEQLLGEAVDGRTDIHAMGAVLYEMATGRRPFTETQTSRLIDAILHQGPVPPRALNARLSPELERIVLKCLEKEPDRRYQSAKELEVDLRRLASPSESSGAYQGRRRHTRAKRIHSLAVLPLVNLAGPDEEYFAEGMTEALIADLAQIGALKVISRTSVMRYKGTDKPLAQIARELDVDGVIEGSTLRAGHQVRVTAQLIHAESDTHLWAKSYERDLNNILVLQREVAQAIADEIQIKLTAKERARLVGGGSVNPEAYEAYLKGRYCWNKRTGQDIQKAIRYFEQAVAIDPNYAPAYAGLADAYHVLWVYTGVSPREMYQQAKTAALKGLAIDGDLAEAHTSL